MPTIPYTEYGLAELNTDSFSQVELFAGDTPQVVTDYGIIGGSLNAAGIPAWTPVFVDPVTRAITLAVHGTTAPNAITVAATPAGVAATSSVPVYKAGCFNIRALNWPASYDLDTERFSAFAAAAGTQIFVKLPFNVA